MDKSLKVFNVSKRVALNKTYFMCPVVHNKLILIMTHALEYLMIRNQVYKAAKNHNVFFWFMTPCRLVSGYPTLITARPHVTCKEMYG